MGRVWVRYMTDDETYYYIKTTMQMATVLGLKVGYEINVDPPPNNTGGYYKVWEI